MSASSYILTTPSCIFFRLSIPVDIRFYFGKRELKKSLGKIPLCEAREKALVLASYFRSLFRKIRRGDIKALRTYRTKTMGDHFRDALKKMGD